MNKYISKWLGIKTPTAVHPAPEAAPCWSIYALKRFHAFLYAFVEIITNRRFEFTEVSYSTIFDGPFKIHFCVDFWRTRIPGEPPWQSRDFYITRDDGRDFALYLYERKWVLEKNKNDWVEIGIDYFKQEDDWCNSMLQAAERLLDKIVLAPLK